MSTLKIHARDNKLYQNNYLVPDTYTKVFFFFLNDNAIMSYYRTIYNYDLRYSGFLSGLWHYDSSKTSFLLRVQQNFSFCEYRDISKVGPIDLY